MTSIPPGAGECAAHGDSGGRLAAWHESREPVRHADRTQQVEPGASSDYQTPVRLRANHVDDPRQLYQRPPLAWADGACPAAAGMAARSVTQTVAAVSWPPGMTATISTGALLSTTPEATPRAEIASWGGGLMA